MFTVVIRTGCGSVVIADDIRSHKDACSARDAFLRSDASRILGRTGVHIVPQDTLGSRLDRLVRRLDA